MEQVPEGINEINVPDRVHDLYALMVCKPMVLSYKLYQLLIPLNPYPMTIFVVINKCWPNHCLTSRLESNWCDLS